MTIFNVLSVDFTGWKLQVLYDNATSEVIDVTTDMTIGGNIEASGTYDIVYTYGGKTFTNTVKEILCKDMYIYCC